MADTKQLPERGPLSENIQIDDAADIVTIYGVKVAGVVLRYFTEPTRAREWFRVINVHNGVSTIETRRDALPAESDGDPERCGAESPSGVLMQGKKS